MLAYDALRVFAIATVVAIHSFMPLRPVLAPTSVPMVIDDLLHYAVPLFVFISGALVWSRPWDRSPGAYRAFMGKRLAQIGLPYLAWALLYLAVLVANSPDPTAVLARAPGLLATGHVWYHLYFIPMLLTFYALTPIASRAIRSHPEFVLIAVYAVRIALWPAASAWLREAAPGLPWQYATHIATHLPHMLLGAWFALRLPTMPRALRRAWPLLLVAGTLALLALSTGASADWPTALRRLSYPLGMAGTVLGLALGAFSLEQPLRRASRALCALSPLTFGVYFVHPLWLLALETAVREAGFAAVWLAWWAVPVAWALIGTASLAVAAILARFRATAWLVGAPHHTSSRAQDSQ